MNDVTTDRASAGPFSELSRAMAEDPHQARRITLPKLATIAAAAAVIYVAKDILLPLAIAMLVTFALSPVVTWLRQKGLPLIASVLSAVAVAFIAIALFFMVVVGQLGQLAQNLPTLQANIITKVDDLQKAGKENALFSRVLGMIAAVSTEIGAAVPAPASSPDAPAADQGAAKAPAEPLPVRIVESQSPVALLQNLVMPLVSPIATAGLIVILVIFMLLERAELRDRFIQLIGSNDLHRTTQVMKEAGHCVAQYLLVQLLVNVIYAIPIGIGLWLIGVPNPVLWGR